jgi:hypothetical protein
MKKKADPSSKEHKPTTLQDGKRKHPIELLPIKDPLARDFYAEMCRIERWDVRGTEEQP